MGPTLAGDEHAELIARQWLARYGIVSREWWRRERPPLAWRSIYIALRRLEMRGEVRRGYFVRGLAGAQFADSAAVEMLRASAKDDENAPLVVMAATDPANAYAVVDPAMLTAAGRTRPRGGSAQLVTRAGRVILAAESFGARMWVTAGSSEETVKAAAHAMAEQVTRVQPGGKVRDLVVDEIDEMPALSSPWRSAFEEAGYRLTNSGLRYYAG